VAAQRLTHSKALTPVSWAQQLTATAVTWVLVVQQMAHPHNMPLLSMPCQLVLVSASVVSTR
jgi:hypothetical protein